MEGAAVVGHHPGVDAGDLLAVMDQNLGPGVAVKHRARRLGVGDGVQDHRLLGVLLAAIGATAAAVAVVVDVAADGARVEAEFGRARGDDLAAPAHHLGLDRLHAHLFLDLVVERRQFLGAVIGKALFPPGAQDAVGRAEAGAHVDHGGPAQTLAGGHQDGRDAGGGVGPGVAVEILKRILDPAGEVLAAHRRPFLQHHHPQPALGQLPRRRRPARAAADDADVHVLADAAGNFSAPNNHDRLLILQCGNRQLWS